MGHVLAGCLTGFSCFLGQGKAKTKTKVWSSWIVARFLLSHACCVRLHMCKIGLWFVRYSDAQDVTRLRPPSCFSP